MKANKIFFCVLTASVLSIQSMSPSDIMNNDKQALKGRTPASDSLTQNSQINVINTIVVPGATSKEVVDLKKKVATIEQKLKNKEALLKKNSEEIEQLKNANHDSQFEEKIEALNKLIVQQKLEIDQLKHDNQNSKFEEKIEGLNSLISQQKLEIDKLTADLKKTEALESALCKFESKGEKLEADMAKLLEDKDAVLKEVEGLKKENEDLKSKMTASEPKEPKKAEVKMSENSEFIALMSQMTTMFTAQMQSQMQLQVQMMNMLSQMQESMIPKMSPYAMDLSQDFYTHKSFYNALGVNEWDIGIPAIRSPWSSYQSPYAIMPEMNRQPAQAPSDFVFPGMRGFDFNQAPAAPQLPELQKQQISFPETLTA